MEEDTMEEDLPGVIESDCQPQAVEYKVVESSTQEVERNWWIALVIATLLNEDMMTKMLSGDVASGTKHVLVWQQFGNMAQTSFLGPSHIVINLSLVLLQL